MTQAFYCLDEGNTSVGQLRNEENRRRSEVELISKARERLLGKYIDVAAADVYSVDWSVTSRLTITFHLGV